MDHPRVCGKDLKVQLESTAPLDHPRVCGKDSHLPRAPLITPGSPPRMRERPSYPNAAAGGGGITPAYAGKTEVYNAAYRFSKDHPRVCGKDPIPLTVFIWKIGSPPRMRERRHHKSLAAPVMRITPAYAGKTNGGRVYLNAS